MKPREVMRKEGRWWAEAAMRCLDEEDHESAIVFALLDIGDALRLHAWELAEPLESDEPR